MPSPPKRKKCKIVSQTNLIESRESDGAEIGIDFNCAPPQNRIFHCLFCNSPSISSDTTKYNYVQRKICSANNMLGT